MQPQRAQTKGNILIIALIAAVVLMVVGLLLFYSVSRKQRVAKPVPETTQVDEQVVQLEKMSISDEIGAIEQDLNNTKLDNLDAGIDQVNSEAAGL